MNDGGGLESGTRSGCWNSPGLAETAMNGAGEVDAVTCGRAGSRGGSSVLLTQKMAALFVDEEDRQHDGACGWRRDEVGEALDLPDLAAAGGEGSARRRCSLLKARDLRSLDAGLR